jgi:hypothetical protein
MPLQMLEQQIRTKHRITVLTHLPEFDPWTFQVIPVISELSGVNDLFSGKNFFCSLLYDAFLVIRLYSVSNRWQGEKWMMMVMNRQGQTTMP